MLRRLTVIALILPTVAGANPPAPTPWTLDEKALIALLEQNPPELARIEAAVNRSQITAGEENENFRWKLFGEAGYQESREKALAAFIPTFGPSYFLSAGVERRFPVGIDLQTSVFGNQQSTLDRIIDKATRTGFSVQASFDLWRNFWGRLDKADLQSSRALAEKQRLQGEIARHAFELDLRKLYWTIVANHAQQTMAQELLNTAQKQLSEGLKRQGQYIADVAEISRYRAQVADRQATVLSFEYRHRILAQQLKSQLPAINDREIILAPYDREKVTAEVLTCAARIAQDQTVPWDHTKWDEVISLIEEDHGYKQRATARYNHPDLTFSSRFQFSGVDQGYADSLDDFVSNRELGYELGLRLDVPLDHSLTQTRSAREKADYQAFLAEKNQLASTMAAHHTEIIRLVDVLNQSLKRIDENNANLRISIKEVERKYRQARVSVNEVIQTQDALLSGLLREVDTKLKVIETLFDYFKVFTEAPCSINRLGNS